MIVINETNYHPPLNDTWPLVILLDANSTAVVISGSITVSNAVSETSAPLPTFDDLQSGSNSIDLLGWTIKFQQRSFVPPTGCSGNIFSCLIGAAGQLFSAAGGMVDGVASVAGVIAQDIGVSAMEAEGLATEAATYAVGDVGDVARGVSAAAEAAGDAVEAMDGVMDFVNANLDNLGPGDFESISGRVFEAFEYEDVRTTVSILRNMNNLFKGLQASTGNTALIQTLGQAARSKYALWVFGAGSSLTAGIWSLERLANTRSDPNWDPDSGWKSPSAPVDRNVTEDRTRAFSISCEKTFPLKAFNAWTRSLDNDAGVKLGNSDLLWNAGMRPAYTTVLGEGQGKMLKKLPWVSSVWGKPKLGIEMDAYVRSPFSQKPTLHDDNASEARKLGVRDMLEGNGFWNQMAMSWNKYRPPGNQRYKRDSSGGEGTIIFIIDTGFDVVNWGVSYYYTMLCECRGPVLRKLLVWPARYM